MDPWTEEQGHSVLVGDKSQESRSLCLHWDYREPHSSGKISQDSC